MAHSPTSRGERAARDFLADLSRVRPGLDPFELLEGQGVVVRQQALEPGMSGVLARRRGRLVVLVNENHPPVRRRFTAAHELGHVMMHLDRLDDTHVDTVVARRDELSSRGLARIEVEANAFAAELLMPRICLLRDVPDGMADPYSVEEQVIAKLARRYKVSRTAMTFRLMNLGLIERY